jgi:hypothetical protein
MVGVDNVCREPSGGGVLYLHPPAGVARGTRDGRGCCLGGDRAHRVHRLDRLGEDLVQPESTRMGQHRGRGSRHRWGSTAAGCPGTPKPCAPRSASPVGRTSERDEHGADAGGSERSEPGCSHPMGSSASQLQEVAASISLWRAGVTPLAASRLVEASLGQPRAFARLACVHAVRPGRGGCSSAPV